MDEVPNKKTVSVNVSHALSSPLFIRDGSIPSGLEQFGLEWPWFGASYAKF